MSLEKKETEEMSSLEKKETEEMSGFQKKETEEMSGLQKKGTEEIYFIKAVELELLLAAAGLKSWYGIPIAGTTKNIKKEDIHTILAGLYQKDYISWDDQSSVEIVLKEPVASLTRTLRDATHCLKMELQDEEAPVVMVYTAGDKCLFLEESPWDQKTYRFRNGTKQDLEYFIKDHSGQIKSAKKTKL